MTTGWRLAFLHHIMQWVKDVIISCVYFEAYRQHMFVEDKGAVVGDFGEGGEV
jgi:hypothetical protein